MPTGSRKHKLAEEDYAECPFQVTYDCENPSLKKAAKRRKPQLAGDVEVEEDRTAQAQMSRLMPTGKFKDNATRDPSGRPHRV
ncbi:hypothetical protein ACHAQH_008562 [Verticillium albo-atrum]